MSNQFIGLIMLVTLNSPPGAQLRGKVSSIVAGQSLTLRDVYCPGNGKTISEITIKATDITDLVEAADENDMPYSAPQYPVARALTASKTFEDPAILSMGKRPFPQTSITVSLPLVDRIISPEALPVDFSAGPDQLAARDPTPAAILIDPMSNLELANGEGCCADDGEAEQGISTTKKTKPRKRKHNRGKKGSVLPDLDDSIQEAIPVSETKRGKGWRQTPLLEPNPSFQPFSTLKKKRNGYENGWATEEATDVQDMGDFDFESNLSKFDKRTVFEGIKAEDMTADEDRLVGHNRLARPGTAGGKNLHPTENVLDLPNDKPAWNSEADDSEAYAIKGSQRDTGSGRGSRRADSKRGESRLRRPPSKKELALNESQSMRRQSSLQPGASTRSSFYLYPENRRCELISALQMLNLENIADSEFGLTEDMMAENAGRGLAQLSLSVIDESLRPRSRDVVTIPHVVIIAGNNKSGVRAVAAGRHLRNHGVNAVVCVLGLVREPELLEGLRKQLKAFRSFGGKVFAKTELMNHIKSLGAPIDLVLDGLLGLTISFEELRTGDQATAYELIEWANRSGADVMAIDIPTGIDPSSGKVSIIDGRPLYIHPTIVVAMGLPKKGLLQAMILGEGVDDDRAWRLFVTDIGIGKQALKKAGTRMRRGVEFDKTWTMELRFHKGVD
ncbi:MAG: enhancer of mRNA decapping [Claussenomyces sp. TS43310]|nr:MAG: enhancer of mRNA decapping [Claussenomyces sp. TS43310]